MRYAAAFVLIVLACILLLLSYELIISSGRIRQYRDENGKAPENSLSEKLHVTINGADNGFFINSRDTDAPVLLFISSGPGTDDYFLNERFRDMQLEDLYTVVYWDYRGMGIAYDPKFDPETITREVLIADAHEVTRYLKERFQKEKIYVMGFSGGTGIGIDVVTRYPEDYHAYIGMAQLVTDGPDRDTLMYQFMKAVFTQRGDSRRLKRLEASVIPLDDGTYRCRDWYSYVYLLHDAGGGTTHNESELIGIDIPIILSRCYTLTEKINYIRGMKLYRRTAYEREKRDYDLRVTHTRFDIPVFFLSGEYDYNCPQPLVEEYCNAIDAPMKGFFRIADAAHSPLWENAEASYRIMKDIRENTSNEG